MTIKTNHTKIIRAGLLFSLATLLTTSAWASPGRTDSSYSFARVVEGSATVISAGGERDRVEPHMPLLAGDRLWVGYDSRLELVLSDRSLLRTEGEAEIDFKAIAYSADTHDPATEIHLREGEIQLIVPEDALGESLPVIATPTATIYVHEPGSFRIEVSRRGWTELVVRDGRAEIAGDRNASLVYPGDMALVEGGSRPYFEIRLAGNTDSLERWGYRLTREASYASVPHVDRSLHYVAAPLASHGGWVTIGGRSAWRPRVEVTWRPYHRGYWRTTPAGLTWVSHDPWGYVTHHYGSWDYVPGYGWVWYPGRTYRTAWVHWYWGNDYVGWCPSGYYASYYGRPGGSGISFGIYGYAGGSWSRFEHWNFTASVHFGRREHRHVYSGKTMGKVVSTRELGRGIITTDPGFVSRKDPKAIVDLLESEVRDYRRTTGRDLPDVSDYVARKPLNPGLREAIVKPKPVTRPRTVRSGSPTVSKPVGGAKPPVVSRELPRGEPGITIRKPRDPMPRVKPRPGRDSTHPTPAPRVERPGRDSTHPTPAPRTKPYRIDPPRERDDKGTVRSGPRESERVGPRGSEPRRGWPERTTKPERRNPTFRPGSEDDDRTLRYKPREIERREEGRREAPRATPPRVERPRTERPRIESSKPTVRYEPKPRVSSPREKPSKPTVRSSPSRTSPTKPRPTVRSDERSKSSKSEPKSRKSSTTVKKKEKG